MAIPVDVGVDANGVHNGVGSDRDRSRPFDDRCQGKPEAGAAAGKKAESVRMAIDGVTSGKLEFPRD